MWYHMGIPPSEWFTMSPLDRNYFIKRWQIDKKQEQKQDASGWAGLIKILKGLGGK